MNIILYPPAAKPKEYKNVELVEVLDSLVKFVHPLGTGGSEHVCTSLPFLLVGREPRDKIGPLKFNSPCGS